MGNPTLYYYPTTDHDAGTVGLLEKVDFGEPISDIQITPLRRVSDTVSLSGITSRTSWQSGIAVRITLERFTDDDLARSLYSFSSHAERGKHFGFAQDSAKAVAVIPRGDWSRGSTVLSGAGNIFRKWETSASLAADDIVHISGPSPRNNREEHKLDAFTLTTSLSNITLDSALRYDHAWPAVLRHRDFYPVLYVPETEIARPMLTHDHRISYNWECLAYLMPHWAATLSEQADELASDAIIFSDATDMDTIIKGAGGTVPITSDGPDVPVEGGDIRVTDMFTPHWWRG